MKKVLKDFALQGYDAFIEKILNICTRIRTNYIVIRLNQAQQITFDIVLLFLIHLHPTLFINQYLNNHHFIMQ